MGSVPARFIKKGMVITEEKVLSLFKKDMERFERHVEALISVPLTQDQFDALVSFTFNLGAGALKTSTLRTLLNQGQYNEVPAQLLRWNKVKGVVTAGLIRRRKAEGALWSKGILKYYF